MIFPNAFERVFLLKHVQVMAEGHLGQRPIPRCFLTQLALDDPEWHREALPIDTQLEAVMAVAAVRPVAIKIDENTKARIRRLADACQRTPHWLMREAITQYVDREEKREAFRQGALQAWEAFRANGQHVTADQADAWLAQLEQGNDVDPPACRS